MDLGDSRFRRRLIPIVLLVVGCGVGDRKVADLQLDIEGVTLIDTDKIRVCVLGTMIHETTVGDGRIAVSGLPMNDPVQLTVSALHGEHSNGGIETIMLDESTPWVSAPWIECDTPCEPCSIEGTQTNHTPTNTRLLAIHLLQ